MILKPLFGFFQQTHLLHRCPMLPQTKILPQSCCRPWQQLNLPMKNWGKYNKATLSKLIKDGNMDFFDTSTANINWVYATHFLHQEKRSLHCNFCDFPAALLAIKREYSVARRIQQGKFLTFPNPHHAAPFSSTTGNNDDVNKDKNINEDDDEPQDAPKDKDAPPHKMTSAPTAPPKMTTKPPPCPPRSLP